MRAPFLAQSFVNASPTPKYSSSALVESDVNCVRPYIGLFMCISYPNGAVVKNIVLTGFGKITLLDLDTIDLSNLNRQFLFRKKDVKQSKAMVRHTELSGRSSAF